MHDILTIALIAIALYCFGMWGFYFYKARMQRHIYNPAWDQAVADFTYRVGLVGTIALAALYIGG